MMQSDSLIEDAAQIAIGAVAKIPNSLLRLTVANDHAPIAITGYVGEARHNSAAERFQKSAAVLLQIDLEARQSHLVDLRRSPDIMVPATHRLVEIRFADWTLASSSRAEGWIVDERLDALGRCIWTVLAEAEPDRQFGESLLRTVLAHLRAEWRSDLCRVMRGGLAPWQQRLAETMLGTNLLHPAPLREVAGRCKLSVSQFTRAFRQTTGTSPHRWVMKRRVAQAKAHLEEGDSALVDIALCCGFADQSHFTRVFAREVGVPPGQWRRLHRSGPELSALNGPMAEAM